jgi:hypothetical protein
LDSDGYIVLNDERIRCYQKAQNFFKLFSKYHHVQSELDISVDENGAFFSELEPIDWSIVLDHETDDLNNNKILLESATSVIVELTEPADNNIVLSPGPQTLLHPHKPADSNNNILSKVQLQQHPQKSTTQHVLPCDQQRFDGSGGGDLERCLVCIENFTASDIMSLLPCKYTESVLFHPHF